MGMWLFMLGCNLLLPAVMLIAGKLFMKRPPKNINAVIGYRTAMSMKNEDTWQFAHAVAGRFWWKWGWVAMAMAVVPMLPVLGQPEKVTATAGVIVIFALMIPMLAVIPHTEKALRNTFHKNGTRKELS